MASAPTAYASSLISSLRGGNAPAQSSEIASLRASPRSQQYINVPGVDFKSFGGNNQTAPLNVEFMGGNLNQPFDMQSFVANALRNNPTQAQEMQVPEIQAPEIQAPQEQTSSNLMPAPVINPVTPYVQSSPYGYDIETKKLENLGYVYVPAKAGEFLGRGRWATGWLNPQGANVMSDFAVTAPSNEELYKYAFQFI